MFSIDDGAIKSKKITGVLQIGNVDLMLEGIEGALSEGVEDIAEPRDLMTISNPL